MVQINLKRVYDGISSDDGKCFLVDRLWPRGISKIELEGVEWEKEIAPSSELREWFHENPDQRWPDFEKKYKQELQANPDFTSFVDQISKYTKVTFLYAAKDETHNNAFFLKGYIESILHK